MKRSSVIWVIVRFEFSTNNGPVFLGTQKPYFIMLNLMLYILFDYQNSSKSLRQNRQNHRLGNL